MAGYDNQPEDNEVPVANDQAAPEQNQGEDGKPEAEKLPPDKEITVIASRGVEVKIVSRVSELKGAAERAVINEETYARGLDLLGTIKALSKKIEETRKSMTDPLNALTKTINGRFKTISEPLEKAEKTIGDKMTAYAREKAERERKERERLAAEQEAAALEVAAAQEAAGDKEAADKTLVTAEKATTKIVADAGKAKVRGEFTDKTGGLRTTWKYRVVDIAKLAADRPDLVEVNAGEFRKAMNELIRTEKIEKDALPGIEFYEEDNFHVR